MQISRFENGGFALHRIELFGYKGWFSAWYSAAGELLDCEQITFGSPSGRKAPKGAKPGLARLGPIYREAAA